MSNLLAGSHIPVLMKALQHSIGPVLELGIGYNSTPLLHWMCRSMDRELVSLEGDRKWWENFTEYGDELHSMKLVLDWNKLPIDKQHWGVVFIDHRPAKERANSAIKLKDTADFVILHDSEPDIDRFYRYGRAYKHFRYRYDFTKWKPNTTVLSNINNLEFLKEL